MGPTTMEKKQTQSTKKAIGGIGPAGGPSVKQTVMARLIKKAKARKQNGDCNK